MNWGASNKYRSLQYWILAIGWAFIIMALSAMPGKQLPSMEWLWQPDKLAHATVYGILAFLIWKAMSQEKSDRKSLFWALIIASLYGIAMEIMQYAFFPGRYFEIWDIVANIIGAIAVTIIVRKWKSIK